MALILDHINGIADDNRLETAVDMRFPITRCASGSVNMSARILGIGMDLKLPVQAEGFVELRDLGAKDPRLNLCP